MNEELQSWSDDIIYKHTLTFSHEELAGMYSLCNKREQDYLKEIKALRLILQSHGEVIEMNAKLKEQLKNSLKNLNIAYHWGLYLYESEGYQEMEDEDEKDNMKSDLDIICDFVNSNKGVSE